MGPAPACSSNARTHASESGPDRSGSDRPGPNWAGSNWAGSNWARPDGRIELALIGCGVEIHCRAAAVIGVANCGKGQGGQLRSS